MNTTNCALQVQGIYYRSFRKNKLNLTYPAHLINNNREFDQFRQQIFKQQNPPLLFIICTKYNLQ